MMEIQLTEQDGQHYADSRMIAESMGVEHESVMRLLSERQDDFGIIRFEIGILSGAGKPPRFALLDERQSLYFITFVKNTEQSVPAKKHLVDAFLALRKTNVVQFPQQLPTAVQLAKWFIEAQEKLDAQAPIIAAHELLTDASGAATMAQVGKVLGIGQKKLFARLRSDGILTSGNLPYQQYLDQGYFIVKDKPIPKGNVTEIHKQTFITPKGESWLARKYGEAS